CQMGGASIMQTFKDTETGQYWQFEDDVIVRGNQFFASHDPDTPLNVPETLIPAELPQPPEPTLEDLRAAKINSATAKRWEVMTGGLTLPTGVEVGTTIDDQNRITSVVANAALAGLTDSDEVDFKAASGWVRITIAQVKQIAGAIGQHVQTCYSAERAHHEAIEALETREEVAAYDVGVGWPEMQPQTETT